MPLFRKELGEQCDDGNSNNNDGCSATCVSEFCGDGVLHRPFGEVCDDGNMNNGDGCNDTCQSELCGDGIIQIELGEQCDDGNNIDGDTCTANCLVEDPPLECRDYDITENQFIIDAGVKKQEYLINLTLRRLQKIDSSRKTKKFATKISNLAHELQLKAWQLSWSIPSTGVTCGFSSSICSTENINQLVINQYTERTLYLDRLLKRSVKRLIRSRGERTSRDKRIRKKGKKTLNNNLAFAHEIPGVAAQACIYPEF